MYKAFAKRCSKRVPVPPAPPGRLWALAAALTLIAQARAQTSAPEGEVVERAVALVAGRVLTLSELEFEASVALIQRGGLQAAAARLDDEALRSALELAIGERLEIDAADKLQAFPIEEGEVDAALRAFRAKFETDADFAKFLQRHEVDVQELAAVLARKLRAEKILDSKIRLRARVSEADVRRYYEQHRSELSGSYEEMRSKLREKLVRDRYAALAREELVQIRKGVDVRLIAPFARAPSGGEALP